MPPCNPYSNLYAIQVIFLSAPKRLSYFRTLKPDAPFSWAILLTHSSRCALVSPMLITLANTKVTLSGTSNITSFHGILNLLSKSSHQRPRHLVLVPLIFPHARPNDKRAHPRSFGSLNANARDLSFLFGPRNLGGNSSWGNLGKVQVEVSTICGDFANGVGKLLF